MGRRELWVLGQPLEAAPLSPSLTGAVAQGRRAPHKRCVGEDVGKRQGCCSPSQRLFKLPVGAQRPRDSSAWHSVWHIVGSSVSFYFKKLPPPCRPDYCTFGMVSLLPTQICRLTLVA